MAYGGLNKKMDAAAELWRNPISKRQIQPDYGDEQADTGWAAEPVSRDQIIRRERGQGNIKVFLVQLTTCRIGNLTRLNHCLLLLLFLTFSVLVANPKKLLYTVANPARGLLNREKRTKEKVWQHTPPPPPTLLVRILFFKKNLNASRPSEHPSVRGEKNVNAFRWDHGLQIQNLFMAFKRVPRQ